MTNRHFRHEGTFIPILPTYLYHFVISSCSILRMLLKSKEGTHLSARVHFVHMKIHIKFDYFTIVIIISIIFSMSTTCSLKLGYSYKIFQTCQICREMILHSGSKGELATSATMYRERRLCGEGKRSFLDFFTIDSNTLMYG